MLTLAQIVASDLNAKDSAAWIALQVFTYGSIISNITTAMLALLAIIFCAELPFNAHKRGVQMKDSWPSRPAHNQEGSTQQVDPIHSPLLFGQFGMSKFYRWVMWGQLAWLILSMILTFLAMITWVKLSQPTVVFWTSLAITIMGFGGLAICLFGHLMVNTFGTPAAIS
jgi:hypothetical protein